jgi:Amt family ammonium transporter
LGTQLTGIVVIGAFTFITSYIVWYVIKLVMGLRISEEEEYDGEDIHAIGVEAYPEFVKNLK